jgi:hypothetical protein
MKRILAAIAILTPLLAAYEAPPVQILRGELIEWDPRQLAGGFAFRDSDSKVHRCRYSSETHILRQTLRVSPMGVRPGDYFEVVAEMKSGLSSCRALTIYVRALDPARTTNIRSTTAVLGARTFMDNLWPRGSLTFSGVVQRIDPNRMIVQTRQDGQKTFHLRSDTLYSSAGRLVEHGRLAVHQRIFVRAGRGIEGEMEAYQIVWGGIVQPEDRGSR